MILVEFAGQPLALTDEEFETARERGLKLMVPPRPQVDNKIVDAAGAEAATGVPATWFLEAARRGDVPCLRLGKYVRFDLTEVVAAARAT